MPQPDRSQLRPLQHPLHARHETHRNAPSSRTTGRSGKIVPPPDGAHAVGTRSGRLRRPPLRAHRVPRPDPKPRATRSKTGPLAELAYHPHIQHANLGITSVYLQGIDSAEIIDTVHSRPAPVISATAGLSGQ
jgi:hypothetical protein